MEKGIKFKNCQDIEYQIVFPNFLINRDGDCQIPEKKNPIIRIDKRLPPKRNMQVVIEEIFHAFFWEKTEKQARKFSSILAKALFEDGYRLNEEHRKRVPVRKNKVKKARKKKKK